jgi:hypothetical protein
MLPFSVPVIFIFEIQGVLKFKKHSGAKWLRQVAHESSKVVSLLTGFLYPQKTYLVLISVEDPGSAVFEALCYKPEVRGIYSRWCQWSFFIYKILPASVV